MLLAAVLLTAAPFSSAFGAEMACAAPAECATTTNNPDSAPLVTADVVALAAFQAEARALQPLAAAADAAQNAYIKAALAALVERFRAWRSNDAALLAALSNLIVEFAVFSRLADPQAEFLLSFDKSVQIRIQSFYRVLASGRSPADLVLPDLDEAPSSEALARLYARLNPADMATGEGRLMALILAHLRRTDPACRTAWDKLTELVEASDGAADPWRRVEEKARELSLGRPTDLENVFLRAEYAKRWTEGRPARPTGAGAGVVADPLPLLPLRTSALAEALRPLAAGGARPSGDRLLDLLGGEERKLARLDEEAGSTSAVGEATISLEMLRQKGAAEGNTEGFLFGPAFQRREGGPNAETALALWTQRGSVAPLADASQPLPETTRLELANHFYSALADCFAARAAALERRAAGGVAEAKTAAETCRQWSGKLRQLAAFGPEEAKTPLAFAPLPEAWRADPDLVAAWRNPVPGRVVWSIGEDQAQAR
ncbi:MAG: hypothetical protein C4523_18780, partial [Myxococcales bacterium]